MSSWVCPACLRLFASPGTLWEHLERVDDCMRATMKRERVAAVCRCSPDMGLCGCSYRLEVG